jgi:menaquinone-dependent protoporphyrinogen oxidase
MRVLVSAASRHGATSEIADHIATTLKARGLEPINIGPEHVDDLDEYQAAVIGSAVYAGHWMQEARDLAGRVAAHAGALDVWLFSSGGVGDPPMPDSDPVEIADLAEATFARGHRLFAGKVDSAKLNFGERAILRAVRAPEGDFRPWGDITTWAESIADVLESRSVPVH